MKRLFRGEVYHLTGYGIIILFAVWCIDGSFMLCYIGLHVWFLCGEREFASGVTGEL
ncbi:MAG: hypothetical protein LBJ00_12600 [Planctomycetaceae bacterium]|nr:hypothetical protein [Planctomycetaceae bacterium]